MKPSVMSANEENDRNDDQEKIKRKEERKKRAEEIKERVVERKELDAVSI